MNGKKKSVFNSVLSIVIVLLVVVLAVGLIFKFTKAGDKIKDLVNPAFRVEYGGKDFTGKDNKLLLPTNGQAEFIVKGVDSYKVSLTPNVTPETDFTYEVGDTIYNFSQADLSKVFIGNESIKNGSFYLECVEDYSIESVLSKIHGGAEIVLNGEISCPYLLSFTSNNVTVSFAFNDVIQVILSESHIIF